MKCCYKCLNLICDDEPCHLVVKEMQTPDTAYFYCEDCFNDLS